MPIPPEPSGLLFKAGGQAGFLSTGEQLAATSAYTPSAIPSTSAGSPALP